MSDKEPTDADLDAIENPDAVQVLKVFGVYTLTADWSILNKGPNDEALFLYCVTNTVTGVREWEDTLFPTAMNYCRDLNLGYEKAIKESEVISLPELLLPKGIQ